MTISDEIRRSEHLSVQQAQRLEKMFEDVEAANPSMPPNIYPAATTIKIDTTVGGESIDGSLFSDDEIAELEKLSKRFFQAKRKRTGKARQTLQTKIFDIIGKYTEARNSSTLYEIDIVKGGWMANLSMPGYMDQTDPSHYKSLRDAIEGLHDMYGEGIREMQGED